MTDVLLDPETDARAAYAFDPARVRALTTVARASGESHRITTPMTGGPLATVNLSTEDDVEQAYAVARAAQPAWAGLSVAERCRIILHYHDLVLANQRELMDLVQLESGKARRHAFEEIADVAICSRHYGRNAERYLRPQKRGPGALPILTQSIESHLPKGVVGIVSPWNYPLSLAVSDAIPALLAGNAVVLRPDMQGMLTALAGVELLFQAGLPRDLFQVVLGPGSSIGQAVVDRADYVCYTGSTATGRRVAASLAPRLVGYSMELGGKNSMYIASDASIRRSVETAVRGCFSSAGQLCISHERLLVHTDIYDAFVPAFVEAVKKMRLGTELSFGFDMGSLVGQQQLETVTEHVEDARHHGATVLAGGRHRPDIGPYVYEPTVLSEVTSEMMCRDIETFGPVTSIYRVSSDEEAIAIANDTPYGLNAAVMTRSVRRGREIAAKLHAGTVNINEAYAAAWASKGSPMGGMKDSGVGRRHGREGIVKYTEPQNVTAQYLLGFGPPPWVSDEMFASTLTTAMRLMKKLGVR
ncbi:MAG: succinate-semialdehyde dehydrogenase (NADP(+)) [Actinomycetales bacterium]|nr:succinate-semialdehyde dehydrogenase (NADP(+)) [Tetrasphaera sp.]NLW99584.1 succinate-semialdehyde dehydrogenase (NADP(+)) [Actinomycetales bacterium]